ncbi:MAG TPA: alpha/beta fold hydrolase [Candidatus Limnocylindrales bacterium]|nr:alpha/beta fold hydrolase [Candidatus Limnocylindrales bacterium]
MTAIRIEPAIVGAQAPAEQHLTIPGPDPIPAILVRPTGSGPWPAVVILHGAGRSKEDNLVDARTLARRGIVAVLVDLRGHGERSTRIADMEDGAVPILDYLPACAGSAQDVSRVAAYLRAVPGLCTGVVGAAGASMGGQAALLAAIADPSLDPLALFSPMIHELPIDPSEYPSAAGRSDELDAAGALVDILGRSGSLHPRRIGIAHGSHDPVAPFARVQRLFDQLAPAYRDQPERLALFVHPGGHGSPDPIIDRLIDWLTEAIAPDGGA